MCSGQPALVSGQIATPLGHGAYVGPGAPSSLTSFGSTTGCAASFAMDFLPMDSWTAMDNPSWLLNAWHGTNTPLALGVPMLTNDTSTNIQAGAAGSYNAYYKTLAQNLVAKGYGSADLRIGWEMNTGNAFRWTAVNDPTSWVTYYKNIVTTMRSVPGQSFKFDWNVNLGTGSVKPDTIYPGDAYVDYVGVDIYDWKWSDPSATPAARWSWMQTQAYGLNWVASFAAAHGKRITIPEWGLAPVADNSGGGGGDDPYYMTSMLAWVRTHDVAYEAYFNWLDHKIDTGVFPTAAAAYKSALRT